MLSVSQMGENRNLAVIQLLSKLTLTMYTALISSVEGDKSMGLSLRLTKR